MRKALESIAQQIGTNIHQAAYNRQALKPAYIEEIEKPTTNRFHVAYLGVTGSGCASETTVHCVPSYAYFETWKEAKQFLSTLTHNNTPDFRGPRQY